jgi:hypothetical protein
VFETKGAILDVSTTTTICNIVNELALDKSDARWTSVHEHAAAPAECRPWLCCSDLSTVAHLKDRRARGTTEERRGIVLARHPSDAASDRAAHKSDHRANRHLAHVRCRIDTATAGGIRAICILISRPSLATREFGVLKECVSTDNCK